MVGKHDTAAEWWNDVSSTTGDPLPEGAAMLLQSLESLIKRIRWAGQKLQLSTFTLCVYETKRPWFFSNVNIKWDTDVLCGAMHAEASSDTYICDFWYGIFSSDEFSPEWFPRIFPNTFIWDGNILEFYDDLFQELMTAEAL